MEIKTYVLCNFVCVQIIRNQDNPIIFRVKFIRDFPYYFYIVSFRAVL